MTHGTYRNDLDAAQRRSAALEADLASAQLRIQHLEGTSKPNALENGSLQRLLNSGALEDKLAHNRKIRREAKEQAAANRSKLRQKRWDRWAAARRRRRSMSFYPMLSRWSLLPLAIFALLPFTALFLIVPAAQVALVAFLVLLAAMHLPSVPWGWWAMHRERGRVGQLPFRVSGHIAALGQDKRTRTVRISFDGNAPTSAEARALLLGLARDTTNPFTALSLRETEVDVSQNTLTFSGESIETTWHMDNRGYLLWYRRLVESGAVVLHQTYPVDWVGIE